jgi:site-specific DNA recombinase
MTRTTTRTVAYVRVSTDKQADKGVSLEAQQSKIRAYAELYDLELVDVIVDAGESAKSLDRPGLRRALAMLDSGEAAALLVVKLDRLTRSVVDLGALVERYFASSTGAALLSVSEQIDTRSAAGRLVLNVLGAVSQWEREAIGERTSAALQHKASKGEYTGGHARKGYSVGTGGQLVADEAEQAAIAMAAELRAAGRSYRAVAAELAAAGHVNRNGRAYSASSIRNMVAA